jgi:hypothetical protein
MSRKRKGAALRATDVPGVVHTWPPEGIPEGMGYLETTSRVDGAPVRIAVPEDPDGEVEAVSEAFNDPEILRHVGTAAELESADGPPIAIEQVYADLGLAPPGRRYSGTFRVRVPKDLHRTLAAQAAQQGVSLNTLIVSYLADRAARREAAETGR